MNRAKIERVYPDTSYRVAMKCAGDTRHAAWREFHPRIEHATLLWSPWTHFEFFNTLRQLTLGPNPPLEEAECRRILALTERQVRPGYFEDFHRDWREELREARELSAQWGTRLVMRAADTLHVAIARLAGADLFVTCDKDQHALAEAAGLTSVLLPENPSRQ